MTLSICSFLTFKVKRCYTRKTFSVNIIQLQTSFFTNCHQQNQLEVYKCNIWVAKVDIASFWGVIRQNNKGSPFYIFPLGPSVSVGGGGYWNHILITSDFLTISPPCNIGALLGGSGLVQSGIPSEENYSNTYRAELPPRPVLDPLPPLHTLTPGGREPDHPSPPHHTSGSTYWFFVLFL